MSGLKLHIALMLNDFKPIAGKTGDYQIYDHEKYGYGGSDGQFTIPTGHEFYKDVRLVRQDKGWYFFKNKIDKSSNFYSWRWKPYEPI